LERHQQGLRGHLLGFHYPEAQVAGDQRKPSAIEALEARNDGRGDLFSAHRDAELFRM